MSAVNFDTWAIEAEFAADTWTDITADVVGEIFCKQGITTNNPKTRTASSGYMTIDLNNSASNSAGLVGYYSPHHTNCRSGFGAGLRLRIKFTYGRIGTVIKFMGRIPPNGIDVDPGAYRERRTHVKAYDWMYEASQHELEAEVEDGLRADQAIEIITAEMSNAPANTSLSQGASTFPTVFDKDGGGMALSAMQKLALSEFGYVYVIGDSTDGETLVFENRYDRGLTDRLEIIKDYPSLDRITDTSSNLLTTVSGDYICIDSNYDAVFDDLMDLHYDEQLYNYAEITVNPRETDNVNTITLAQLNKRVFVAAGESQDIKIPYRDPDNKAVNVAGIDMIDPVAGTDYDMTANDDGTGTDYTDDLTVTPSYASTSVTYTVTNTGATGGWVYVQARGRGVYSYDTVISISQDSASIAALKQKRRISLNLPYQDDAFFGQSIGDYFITEYSTAKPDIAWVEDSANVSDKNMGAFLLVTSGKRIGIDESMGAADNDYFVNGNEFTISGGLVTFRWYLTRAFSANDDWFILDSSLLDGAKVLAP